VLVLVLTQSNPNPPKSSALSYRSLPCPGLLLSRRPNIETQVYIAHAKSPALHCIASQPPAPPKNTYATRLSTSTAHTHAHTSSSPRPFRAAAANQPPLPPPPTSALRSALPYVCCLLQHQTATPARYSPPQPPHATQLPSIV
jgi:hypothetical protein